MNRREFSLGMVAGAAAPLISIRDLGATSTPVKARISQPDVIAALILEATGQRVEYRSV